MTSSKFYPVLIVPGFMSSGLEVVESDTKSWVGKRVWINLQSLGFSSMHRGSALIKNASIRDTGDPAFSQQQHEEYERQFACKNKWLHHMSLSNDLLSERSNIKVRPISGLNGVDYLTTDALKNHTSYVFGPVICALKDCGYTDSNLNAAPYDWRLPPSELEKRDNYFSNTMLLIEDMYHRNNNTPVILLCHSLGCKTGHYLLNFAKDHSKGGQDWIDKYIHSYVPVGAPHLGAPKAVRGLVDGDKMGLDAFLSDEEGLIMGRSIGSVPWLTPRILPPKTPAVVYMRREGCLQIKISPIDCTDLLRERQSSPPQLRLVLTCGKDVLYTEFQSAIKTSGKLIFDFNGSFTFPTPPEIPESDNSEGIVQIVLQEPGIKGAKQQAQKEKSPFLIRCVTGILMCPIRYFLCLPCTLVGKTYKLTKNTTYAIANLTATAAGVGTNVSCTNLFPLSSVIDKNRCEAEVKKILLHVLDDQPFFKSRRRAHVTAKFCWTPPKDQVGANVRKASPVATVSNDSSQNLLIQHHKNQNIKYDITDGCELLAREGMQKTLNFVSDFYESDNLGPRTRSASEVPPVRRIFAIFGVNRATEVGSVYRRRCLYIHGEHKVYKLHTLDKSARIMKNESSLHIDDGILMETKQEGRNSGDGTVPFYSMDQCRKWESDSCKVDVSEIEGAEHREILADKRFHKILIDYVTIKET